MDQNEEKSQAIYSEMQRTYALKKEFENLRPKWWQPIGKLISYVCLIFLFSYLFPETIEQPVIYILLILVFGVSMENFHESKRINQRIDLLHKMLKEDS
ncbi:hypothetical protein [Pseudoalteromonas shioyasakiensis]|uniref:hypothetical protein n=1 Tax=Pseudoalteromonas shioyasakiensis TaxID=1190813 RepID=UPI001C3CC0C8|nr:hypothetical protein [Pseudoalteromonas shioyasakiensis]